MSTKITKQSLLATLGLGVIALILAAPVVVAMSQGRGRTQIQFCVRIGDSSSSRFFAKIDVSGALSSNGNNTGSATSTSTSTDTGTGTGTCSSTGHHGDDDDQGENEDGNHSGNGKGKDKGNERSKSQKGKGKDSGENSGGKHGKSGNFSLAGQTVTLTIGSASFSGTADNKGRVSTPFDAKLTADGNILQLKAEGLKLDELLPVDPTDGSHTVTVEIKVTATAAAAGSQPLTLSDQNVTFDYRVRHGRAQGKSE